MTEQLLRRACKRGELRLLDLHVGLFIAQLADQEKPRPELLLVACLASAAVGRGHVCLPLDRAAELGLQPMPDFCNDIDQWRTILLESPVVGTPDSTAPLILDEHNRLYLYRYFRYEEQVAADLTTRAAGSPDEIDPARAADLLERLFGPSPDGIDYQKTAAAMALVKSLLVISGGPGTGKTHTVARILALVRAMEKRELRIGLAAPTGKAAARLDESIRKAAAALPPELGRDLHHQAHTLHRLLGYRPGGRGFRHNRDNPLHLDLVVLDEASMIDIVVMDALLQALPPRCRLILLGDHHQLASVEAGSLFADLCASGGQAWSSRLTTLLADLTRCSGFQAGKHTSSMADSVITLQTSYRFSADSGIGRLALAVNRGSIAEVEAVTEIPGKDLVFCHAAGRERRTWLEEQLLKGYKPLLEARSLAEAFTAMERFRVLCALRNGPDGVEAINTLARQVLAREGLIATDTEFYPGRPLIIRRNQYDLQLFNGDTGILWPDEEGRLRAWFMDAARGLRGLAPARLPAHETAYGLTIHKSQGSEFDQVLLLLPETESRVLGRELLYTGITRARSRLTLCATGEILTTAIRRKIRRWSGLGERLWA